QHDPLTSARSMDGERRDEGGARQGVTDTHAKDSEDKDRKRHREADSDVADGDKRAYEHDKLAFRKISPKPLQQEQLNNDIYRTVRGHYVAKLARPKRIAFSGEGRLEIVGDLRA